MLRERKMTSVLVFFVVFPYNENSYMILRAKSMGVIGNEMEKLNFEEVNRLIAAVHEMERDFQFIFQDRPGQEEQIKELSAEILAGQAKVSRNSLQARLMRLN